VVHILLDEGADVNTKDGEYRNAIYVASGRHVRNLDHDLRQPQLYTPESCTVIMMQCHGIPNIQSDFS
jgi:hypothetical protein